MNKVKIENNEDFNIHDFIESLAYGDMFRIESKPDQVFMKIALPSQGYSIVDFIDGICVNNDYFEPELDGKCTKVYKVIIEND